MAISSVSRKAVALLALVFVLGAGFGVVGTRLVNQRVFGARVSSSRTSSKAPEPVPHLNARLADQLKLTPDQQKQVNDILNEEQTRDYGVRQQMNPQFDEIRNQGRGEIRQVLTDQQRSIFDDFVRHVDEERRVRRTATPAPAPTPAH
jgi:hypothetical protein